MDGFFVAKLRKMANGDRDDEEDEDEKKEGEEEESMGGGEEVEEKTVKNKGGKKLKGESVRSVVKGAEVEEVKKIEKNEESEGKNDTKVGDAVGMKRRNSEVQQVEKERKKETVSEAKKSLVSNRVEISSSGGGGGNIGKEEVNSVEQVAKKGAKLEVEEPKLEKKGTIT